MWANNTTNTWHKNGVIHVGCWPASVFTSCIVPRRKKRATELFTILLRLYFFRFWFDLTRLLCRLQLKHTPVVTVVGRVLRSNSEPHFLHLKVNFASPLFVIDGFNLDIDGS